MCVCSNVMYLSEPATDDDDEEEEKVCFLSKEKSFEGCWLQKKIVFGNQINGVFRVLLNCRNTERAALVEE